MNENIDSGADALIEDLTKKEFQSILNSTVVGLLTKAWEEHWQIKHIEFWLKVKNAQNLEKLVRDLSGGP